MLIHFEDHGQDFLTWQVDNLGFVVDCRPFQASVWCGVEVLGPRRLFVGGTVRYVRGDRPQSKTIRYPIKAIEPDMSATEFNARYAVGSACRYYPIAGDSAHRMTKTRSEAWTLAHGAVIVKVEGVTGGVDLNHLVMEG
jgi:hypothetical protein